MHMRVLIDTTWSIRLYFFCSTNLIFMPPPSLSIVSTS